MIFWLSIIYFIVTTTLAIWSLSNVANANNCPKQIKKSVTSLFLTSTFFIIASHVMVWDTYVPYYLAETNTIDLMWIMLSVSIYDLLMFRVSCSMLNVNKC